MFPAIEGQLNEVHFDSANEDNMYMTDLGVENFLLELRDKAIAIPDLEYLRKVLLNWGITEPVSPFRKWKINGRSWAKYLSSTLYNSVITPVSSGVLSIAGEIAFRNMVANQDFYFEIARYADWKPGSFRESATSCWWRSENSSRLGLMENPKGHSVLFYDSPESYKRYRRVRGIGRCWAIIDETYATIFNAYGLRLSLIAEVLSKFWGVKGVKRKVKVTGAWLNGGEINNEEGGGRKYGTGFVFTTGRIPKQYFYAGDITPTVECQVCGQRFRFNNLNEGTSVCPNCIAHSFFCGSCGVWRDKSEQIQVWSGGGENFICNRHGHNLRVCHIHGITTLPVYPVWHTNRVYCSYCTMEQTHIISCPWCGRWKDKFVLAKVRGRTMTACTSCFKNLSKGETHGPTRTNKLRANANHTTG